MSEEETMAIKDDFTLYRSGFTFCVCIHRLHAVLTQWDWAFIYNGWKKAGI